MEARLKVTDTIGIVPFVDAGLVTASSAFEGNDDFQVGVGLGLRYYTAVGPIRLDVAFPLDPRSGDPTLRSMPALGRPSDAPPGHDIRPCGAGGCGPVLVDGRGRRTKPPRDWLSRCCRDILSSEGRRVEIDQVDISLDGDVAATRVEVRDATGVWLTIENLKLEWQPLSLLSDSLQIDGLTIERVLVARLPEDSESEKPVDTPDELQGLRDAVIAKLAVATLQLSPAVAGEEFRFKIDGSGTVKAEPAEVRFKLAAVRTNGGDSSLTAEVALNPVSRGARCRPEAAREPQRSRRAAARHGR